MSRNKSRRHRALHGYPVWIRSLYVLSALGVDLDLNVLELDTKAKEPTLDEIFSFDVLNALRNHSRLRLHRIIETLSHSSSSEAVLEIIKNLVTEGLVNSETLIGNSRTHHSKTRKNTLSDHSVCVYCITEKGMAQLTSWNAQGWGEIVCAPRFETMRNELEQSMEASRA